MGVGYNKTVVNAVFVEGVAFVLNITSNSIKILSTIETPSASKTVVNMRIRTEATGTVDLAYTYQVNVQKTVLSVDSYTKQLAAAVSSGDFTTLLQNVAKSMNVTALAGASSAAGDLFLLLFCLIAETILFYFNVSIIVYVVTNAPTRAPTYNPTKYKYPTNSPTAVSPGGIAGIVIGCVAFVLLVAAGVYYYLNGYKWTPTGEAGSLSLRSNSFLDVNPAKLEETAAAAKVEGGFSPEPTTVVVEKNDSVVVF